MEERASERDLVVAYKLAKTEVKGIDKELKEAEKIRDKAEFALIELLVANNADATAKYEGLGYGRLNTTLFASCKKDNQEKFMEDLKKEDREDVIETVTPKGKVTTYVKELIENGKPVPEYLTYYFKQTICMETRSVKK